MFGHDLLLKCLNSHKHIMTSFFPQLICIVTMSIALAARANAETEGWSIEAPQLGLANLSFDVKVTSPGNERPRNLRLEAGGESHWLKPQGTGTGNGNIYKVSDVTLSATGPLIVTDGSKVYVQATQTVLPAWLSLLPVILALAMAIALRQVIPAIFIGLWAGAALAQGLHVGSLWTGLLDSFAIYILNALADADHMSIILFSLMIGGMVGIINKNGGMEGIVRAVSGFATSRERGQLATGMMGTAIFFDDYANTMVVGNTMRPITDRLRISREKLAYLVDSTAAPIASIGIITTWIGFQVGLIDDAAKGLEGLSENAYSIFLNSLPYAFYSILAIVFVYMVAITGRDFGPMLRAEKRATTSRGLGSASGASSAAPEGLDIEPEPLDTQPRLLNAILPLAVLIFGTLTGIYVTGSDGLSEDASLRDIIGNGNSYVAMIWASSLAVLVAIAASLLSRSLSLEEAVSAWVDGVKTMIFAVIVLTLAWSLAGVNDALHTADFLAQSLSDHMNPALLPVTIFILSAAMAFATGSSWGVMGIMIPLAIPLTWTVAMSGGGTEANLAVFYASIAALLSGAVWGDHSSPISDTTILSSMASDCDHLAHVHTQLPYAFAVASIAIIMGSLPAGFGVSPWISLPLGALALYGVLKVFGRRS